MIVMLAAQHEFSSSDNALADYASCYMYTQLFNVAPYLYQQSTLPHLLV
jgi:hypothetical protein